MPRVSTVDEVIAASRHKQAEKQAPIAQAQMLGVPALPAINIPSMMLITAAVEWIFVPPTYQESPGEFWALVLDQPTITDVDRKHRQLNIEGAKPQLSFYTDATPYLIVRTVG